MPRLVVAPPGGIPDDDRAAVQTFLDSSGSASPFQDPYFAGANALGAGYGALSLQRRWHYVRDGGQVVGVGLGAEEFAIDRRFPGLRALLFALGPVVEGAEALRVFLSLIEREGRARNMVYVDIQPQWTGEAGKILHTIATGLGWVQGTSVGTAQMNLRTDLTGSLEQILYGFDQETRYKVRRAERLGVNVRASLADEDVRKSYECVVETARRKGFGIMERQNFLETIVRLKGDPLRGTLLLAEVGDDLLGVNLVLRAGQGAFYLVGGSTGRPDLRKLPIGYLLQYRAMAWAKEVGATFYDFGGYDPNDMHDVARFKRGFGGTPNEVLLYRRVLRRGVYALKWPIEAARDHLANLKSSFGFGPDRRSILNQPV
jgi:hypothetical protein